jgi:hypothetical protein
VLSKRGRGSGTHKDGRSWALASSALAAAGMKEMDRQAPQRAETAGESSGARPLGKLE